MRGANLEDEEPGGEEWCPPGETVHHPEWPAAGSPVEVQSACRGSSSPGQSTMPLVVGRAFHLQMHIHYPWNFQLK